MRQGRNSQRSHRIHAPAQGTVNSMVAQEFTTSVNGLGNPVKLL
jgi:hypothetical protein